MSIRTEAFVITLVLGGSLVAAVGVSKAATIGFTADYLLLFDGEDFCGTGDHLNVVNLQMSGDGSTLALAGYCSSSGTASFHLIDTATGQRSQVSWPVGVTGIWAESLSIDQDGSRVFFVDYPRDSLFVVEGGVATKILDSDDYSAINGIYKTRTLPDGSWVYFNEDRDDIWRVAVTGGAPERIVADELVDLGDGKTGWSVDDFDVSVDGSTIAFLLKGYHPGPVQWPEVFVQSGGGVTQLTDESWPSWPYYQGKSHVQMDGAGTILTYLNSAVNQWLSLRIASGQQTWLHPSGFNVGGSALTDDGTRLFYYDSEAQGGHLARTDGSGGLDLFPAWNVATITIAAIYDPRMSTDGTKVAFASGLNVYFGRLNPSSASSWVPEIDALTFDPPWVPDTAAVPQVILAAMISDPDGLGDVSRTATDHLIGGQLAGWSEIPIHFNYSVHDDGQPPDPVLGDGEYCTLGDDGGAWGSVSEVTIRVAAQDFEGHVTVADTVLNVCPPGSCWIFADGFESGDVSAW